MGELLFSARWSVLGLQSDDNPSVHAIDHPLNAQIISAHKSITLTRQASDKLHYTTKISLINLLSSVYTMWWILSTYNIYNFSQFLCIQILSFFKRENTIGVFMALSQNTYLQEFVFFNIEHVNINFTTMCWRISLIIIKENQQTPRSFQPCIFGPQPFNISLISSSREQTNSEHMRPGIKKLLCFTSWGANEL